MICHIISLISACLHAEVAAPRRSKLHVILSELHLLYFVSQKYGRVSMFVDLNVAISTFYDTFKYHYFTLS